MILNVKEKNLYNFIRKNIKIHNIFLDDLLTSSEVDMLSYILSISKYGDNLFNKNNINKIIDFYGYKRDYIYKVRKNLIKKGIVKINEIGDTYTSKIFYKDELSDNISYKIDIKLEEDVAVKE